MTEEKAFMFGNNTAVLEESNLQSMPGRELDFRGQEEVNKGVMQSPEITQGGNYRKYVNPTVARRIMCFHLGHVL